MSENNNDTDAVLMHSPIGDNPCGADDCWEEGWRVMSAIGLSQVRLSPDSASIPVGLIGGTPVPVRHIPRDKLSQIDRERSLGWELVELPEDVFGQGRIGWVRDVALLPPPLPAKRSELAELVERLRIAYERKAQAEQEIVLVLGEFGELVAKLADR